MRIGIVGAVVVIVALVFSGAALADQTLTEISVSGKVAFYIGSITDFAGEGEIVDNWDDDGYTSDGTSIDLEVTVTSGNWEGTIDDGASASLTYKADVADVTLATDIGADLYDLAGDVVPGNIGGKVVTDYITVLVNNDLYVPADEVVGSEVQYNFGAELSYDLESALESTTIGVAIYSVNMTGADFEGTAYAAKVSAGFDGLTLTGEYGVWSPAEAAMAAAAAGDSSNAYYAGLEYAFSDATATASYKMDFAEATTLKAGLEYPLTDIVTLDLGWEGETPKGGDQASTIDAKLTAALTDNVTAVLDVTSPGEGDVAWVAGVELAL